MRCLFEVLATGVDVARFPRRNGGGVDEVPFIWISGLDVDFMDKLAKLKIFRGKSRSESEWLRVTETMKQIAKKGAWLEVKFKTLKEDDRFEHCTVITVQAEDVKLAGKSDGVQAGNGVQSAQVYSTAAMAAA